MIKNQTGVVDYCNGVRILFYLLLLSNLFSNSVLDINNSVRISFQIFLLVGND